MKPELCSVHTHSTLCDGKGTLEEMAAGAFAAETFLRGSGAGCSTMVFHAPQAMH